MQNSMVRFIQSVLDSKYTFWANLVQKVDIVSLSKNLVLRLIIICRIQWECSLFLVLILNNFLDIFGPKIQIVCSKRNLIPRQFEYGEFNGGAHCICFRQEITFLSKFGPKDENCQLQLKFGA